MTIILHLPWPTTSNHANKFGRGRVYPSKAKVKFLDEADALALTQKPFRKVRGPFTYHAVFNQKYRLRKDGKPKEQFDGENRLKICVDYAQRIGLIEDDYLAQGGAWSWGECLHGAMLSIHPWTGA